MKDWIHNNIKISGVIFIVALLATSCRVVEDKRSNLVNDPKTEVTPKEDPEIFTKKLQELGYFKYADPKDLPALHKDMTDSYRKSNELGRGWDEKYVKKDYRYHGLDYEELYQEGGFKTAFKLLVPTFQKLGLKMNVTDDYEAWDPKNEWANHTITINAKKYIILKDDKEGDWNLAAYGLAEILNDQLELQNIKEKVFLISGGNDGSLIFLTEPQFEYIDSKQLNRDWRPYRHTDLKK